ncbi:hypothetical protein CVT24_012062 [Panaeolus cyanescens]|uniref:Uncharacterized protein n=1 Tax=Panaeolus cyanescens TaxID=181874 RepID=A0A409VHY5_9AGAR|nr:hypothetical protein CVT24_012062 [Panaeolus cyanescens]
MSLDANAPSRPSDYVLALLRVIDEEDKANGELLLGKAKHLTDNPTPFEVSAICVLQALITYAPSPESMSKKFLKELEKCGINSGELTIDSDVGTVSQWADLAYQQLRHACDLSALTHFASHYFTHLVVSCKSDVLFSIINPGGQETPSRARWIETGGIEELDSLLDEATRYMQSSLLTDLAQTLAAIKTFSGCRLTSKSDINHPRNAINLLKDAHHAMRSRMAWGIEAISVGDSWKYFYRVVRPNAQCASDTNIEDGDELCFGQGEGGDRVELPSPQLCNLHLAVCRIAHASGADELFDRFIIDGGGGRIHQLSRLCDIGRFDMSSGAKINVVSSLKDHFLHQISPRILCFRTGPEWAWTKGHSWQSWRERYKKNEDRFNSKISKLLKSKKNATLNGDGTLHEGDEEGERQVVKKEGKKKKETHEQREETVVVVKKESPKRKSLPQSQSQQRSQSMKMTQDLPSSSLTMPPPGQRPIPTPKSTADDMGARTRGHIASDNYDGEVFGSTKENTDDGTHHSSGSDQDSSSDDDEKVANTRKPTTRTQQRQDIDKAPRAPSSAHPSKSQIRPLQFSKPKPKPKTSPNKPVKAKNDDIFGDPSSDSDSAPAGPRRPTTAVRVQEGPFKQTVKRGRESTGDGVTANWPPKRRKMINGDDGAQEVQETDNEVMVQKKASGQASRQQQQTQKQRHKDQEDAVVAVKPHPPHAAVASSSRTRLEDMPPPPLPTKINGKTRAEESRAQPTRDVNALNGNEGPTCTRSMDALPLHQPSPLQRTSRSMHLIELEGPKVDFNEIRKSRRSIGNSTTKPATSSRASSRHQSLTSVTSHNNRKSRSVNEGSRRTSLAFSAVSGSPPMSEYTPLPSRPRPSAIQIASTQDTALLAELGMHHALTAIGKEYGFSFDFVMTIYEQTRDLGYTKYMMSKFGEAVRREADALVERIPGLLWENRQEGIEVEGLEEEEESRETVDEEEEDERVKIKSNGKQKERARHEEREQERRRPDADPTTPRSSPPLEESVRPRKPRPSSSQKLASVIRPIAESDLRFIMRREEMEYEPPGKSRAGTFVRLERRGMRSEAEELERRRVSGEWKRAKRRSLVTQDAWSDEEDKMDVDGEQEDAESEDEGKVRAQEEINQEEDVVQVDEADSSEEEGSNEEKEFDELRDETEGVGKEHREFGDELQDEDEQEVEEEVRGDDAFKGLFTQIPGADEDDDDDIYVSETEDEEDKKTANARAPSAPEVVTLPNVLDEDYVPQESDCDVDNKSNGAEPEPYQLEGDPSDFLALAKEEYRREHEALENEEWLEGLAAQHYQLSSTVTPDASDAMRKFEVAMSAEGNRDLLWNWSLEWLRKRVGAMNAS